MGALEGNMAFDLSCTTPKLTHTTEIYVMSDLKRAYMQLPYVAASSGHSKLLQCQMFAIDVFETGDM